MSVRYGIDRIAQEGRLLQGKRLGLITSPTGLNAKFESTIKLLHDDYRLTALFSPEHGVRGDRQAGAMVDTYLDPLTGVPVYSLYRRDSKRLTDDMLDAVDAIVYDIQDVGVRYYTFVYTMLYALEDCAKAGKPFIVLDRPNPLDGVTVEGGILRTEYRSFVGNYPMSVRYGLTCGEVATMANDRMGWNGELHVIRCEGWERSMLFPETGRLWVPPSMGLPRFESALLYPGTCLFEGTNVSEGRGTTAPFEIVGAPFIEAEKLADAMNRMQLPGVVFRPIYYKPVFSKFQGELCGGVHLHVSDIRAVQPLETGVRLLYEIMRRYEAFEFLSPFKEGGRPFIDLLGGSDVYRHTEPDGVNALLERFREESAAFAEQKRTYHFY
ncbi:exo-beta-N-acetylmuramidase NamZ family protein [Cohnella panacarvi]|uniref:exo-beta-N-acetylmuramidase NamZ family protein n=1 Tax=Cohnella panacarvi TaxID=400776 RepID=UPI000478D202|nr:DUF1343 domain-containing protein [Cohnella panacarvi]